LQWLFFTASSSKAGLIMTNLTSLTRILTLGMATLSLPTLAIAQPTLFDIGNSGQLVAKGAGIVVPVTVACTEESSYADFYVRITQRVGSRAVSGYASESLGDDCSSTPETNQVLISPDGRIFRKGTAAAQGAITSCDDFGCSELRDQGEIVVQ
jgi:hypothetical protein